MKFPLNKVAVALVILAGVAPTFATTYKFQIPTLGLRAPVVQPAAPAAPDAPATPDAPAVPQLSVRFDNCGATGRLGPASCAYTGQLAGATVINGIQNWTVPTTGMYKITAAGASGGGASASGRGAILESTISLTAGTTLKILVGQAGQAYFRSDGTFQSGGGGGGTFVAKNDNTPLLVAGGGGGQHQSLVNPLSDASLSTSGKTTDGYKGDGGYGGGVPYPSYASGGGGFTGNGSPANYLGTSLGKSFTAGGTGGDTHAGYKAVGGFGGGAGTLGDGGGGGGGGGYSGGGAGGYSGTVLHVGGGGGSYSTGTLGATSVTNIGHGYVTITLQ